MRKVIYIIFGISLALFQSCDYGILYDIPQPAGLNDNESFPHSLLGTYYDDSSKVSLVIEPTRIIKITKYDISASKAEIDTMTDCKLIGDSLFLSDIKQFVYVEIENDSIYGVLARPDTLFTLSDNNILRNLKKNYFLNLAHESGYWQVIRLRELEKEMIEFSVVPQKVDYEKLNNITTVKQLKDQNDSILNYQINPSVRELKAMIRAGLFSGKEIYYKKNFKK
jgi:hypothetical protein